MRLTQPHAPRQQAHGRLAAGLSDHLDLWQLHDLRTQDDLARIFAKGGALEALLQAREERRVRPETPGGKISLPRNHLPEQGVGRDNSGEIGE